jgi:hypothetical protein
MRMQMDNLSHLIQRLRDYADQMESGNYEPDVLLIRLAAKEIERLHKQLSGDGDQS